MNFYKKYLETSYQFSKFDLIFAPELYHNSLESIGCVLYNENYLSVGKNESQLNKSKLATIILKSMAYMWFGNLVTIKNSNEVWLNECVARFLSFLVIYESK